MWLNGIFLNIHVRFCFLEILNFKQLLNVFYIVFSVCILHIYLTYILYLHSVCSDLYNLFLQSFPDASCDDDTITSKIADDDDDDDEVHIESEDICQVLQYEYHILFSCSYSTPVLYFRAFTQGRSHTNNSNTIFDTLFGHHLYILFNNTEISATFTCYRGKEPLIRGGVELSSSELQTTSSKQSPQYNQSGGKKPCKHCHQLHHRWTFALRSRLSLCFRSIHCWASLFSRSILVEQRSSWDLFCRQLMIKAGTATRQLLGLLLL